MPVPVRRSDIPNFISVFLLLIFINGCWIFLDISTPPTVFSVTSSLEGLTYLAQAGTSTVIEGWLSHGRFLNWLLSSSSGKKCLNNFDKVLRFAPKRFC